MERAIRVHQSLLNRTDLPVAERDHAQHELAQDFLKAGMLDRAESAFNTLKDTRFALPALRSLVRIYESEHDWPRAIEVVKTLQGLVDEPVPQIVHYHCELAQAALAAKPMNAEAANAALDAADHAVKGFDAAASRGGRARIAMLRAQLAQIEQNPKRERLYLESILTSAPEYAGLVAERLLANYTQTGEAAQGLDVLRRHYAQHASLDLFNVVFRELRTQRGQAQAWRFAREAMRNHPSLLGLDRLLEVELANPAAAPAAAASEAVPTDERRDDAVPGGDLTLLRSLIHKHTQRLDRYVCKSCGFQPRSFYWQCPGCNAWETSAPRRLEELE
jgi:lipopolysaccharide biosynthesis regulator YciM